MAEEIKNEEIIEETAEVETEETVETEPNVEIDIDELKKENEELKAQIKANEDYKDKWIRSVAEFDNYKKRNAKIWQDAFVEGQTDVIIKVLDIGDNLERALAMDMDEKTKEGIAMLYKIFNETLKNLGVTEINPVGEKFDPLVAEAVMQAEGTEEESETVKMVFQKGYKLKEKVIRYAKVSVVK
jgi:molecular chaperone GrpE